jgi:hypothetical protein
LIDQQGKVGICIYCIVEWLKGLYIYIVELYIYIDIQGEWLKGMHTQRWIRLMHFDAKYAIHLCQAACKKVGANNYFFLN